VFRIREVYGGANAIGIEAINADGNYIKLFPIPPINKAFSIKVIEYLMRAREALSGAQRKY
jgi:hypothetical protein